MDYKARFYDPLLGRFIQPDTLIPSPSSSQALNRYTYVNNSPVNNTDSTGHHCDEDVTGHCYNPPTSPITAAAFGSCPVPQEIVTLTQGTPTWEILQYGKKGSTNPYFDTAEYPLFHIALDISVPIAWAFGIPLVIGYDSGYSTRAQNGVTTHNNFNVAVHIGLGVAIPGGIQAHGGILLGSNNGLYIQAGMDENAVVGSQLAKPDSGAYGPIGGAGISPITYPTLWVLTTDEVVANLGGYNAFGIRYLPPGYIYNGTWKSNSNKEVLQAVWANSMGENYQLQEFP